MHNLTKALGGIGGAIILFSFIWHIVYPNPSQLWITIFIGLIIIGFAYVYEWMKRFQKDIAEHNQRIDSMDIYLKEKLEKLDKK